MFLSLGVVSHLTELEEGALEKLIAERRLPQLEARQGKWGWEPESLYAWFEELRQTKCETAAPVAWKHPAPRRESLSPRLRFAVLLRDGFTCRYCGGRPPAVALRIDHIVPVAAGGATTLDNLQTACEACNSGKAAQLLPGLEA